MIAMSQMAVIHNDVEHIIQTTFHAITTCLSKNDVVYELRTKITSSEEKLCSQIFFQQIDNQLIYQVFSDCFVFARNRGLKVIAVNVNGYFLGTKFVKLLLLKFHDLQIIFKICENRRLHNLDVLGTTMRSLKSHENASIWLDAFGSKMVNFDVIRQLPFDGITICKEVFWDLYYSDTPMLQQLISAMKTKANSVAIDGVDSFEKYQFCKQNECFMSGEYFME